MASSNRAYQPRDVQRGLSLLELLIGIMILSFVSLAAVTNMPPPRSSVQAAAERFGLGVSLARDQALATGSPIRMLAAPDGYSFERLDGEEWTRVHFGRFRGEQSLARGIKIEMTATNAVNANAPALGDVALRDEQDDAQTVVILDPLGPPEVFQVSFFKGRRVWVVRSHSDGHLEVRRGR